MSVEYKRQYYLKNKERLAAKRRERYLANRERTLAMDAERYQNNKEEIKARVRAYTANNKEDVNAKKRASTKSNGAIKSKLHRHKKEDTARGRDFDLTYNYVIDLLRQQDNECAQCDTEVKLSWTDAYDPGQFSINRINNKYGHIEGNVEICCLQCNREYKH